MKDAPHSIPANLPNAWRIRANSVQVTPLSIRTARAANRQHVSLHQVLSATANPQKSENTHYQGHSRQHPQH